MEDDVFPDLELVLGDFDTNSTLLPGSIYRSDPDSATTAIQPDHLVMSVLFDEDEAHDAFKDPPVCSREAKAEHTFLSGTRTAENTREELENYALLMDKYQYRTHIFQLLICGRRARFLRWDHSGTIVSASFDYVEYSNLLVEFLYRFSRLTRTDMGFDERFKRATLDSDIDLARIHLREYAQESPEDRDVFTITVSSGLGPLGKQYDLLVWHHTIERETVTGRATRAFPVWNKTLQKVGFFKEYWRAVANPNEAETLEKLSFARVEYIPTLLCGGDVAHHTTINHWPALDDWNCGSDTISVTEHTNHFILIDEHCRPLETFNSTRELLQVTFDAFTGERVEIAKV